MQRGVRPSRVLATGAGVGASVMALAVVLPAAGQDPTASSAPAATEQPAKSPKPGKPEKAAKELKGIEVAVSLTGRVGTRTDTDGDTVYTLTVGSIVYDLDVGPRWWWGEKDPLKGLIGDTTTITGERSEGSTDVDVFTAGGTTLREAGKPPWAGGWKVVGERHPGWAQWKVDKAAVKVEGKGHGRPDWAGPKTPEAEGD
jgi:hypothetical protein